MAAKTIQRSIAELKKNGYTHAIVERWNQFAHIRQDLFGFIDIVAIKSKELGVLAIQACSDDSGDVSSHVKKLMDNPNLKIWLQGRNSCEIYGWGHRGERGKRKVWTLRKVKFMLDENEDIISSVVED